MVNLGLGAVACAGALAMTGSMVYYFAKGLKGDLQERKNPIANTHICSVGMEEIVRRDHLDSLDRLYNINLPKPKLTQIN